MFHLPMVKIQIAMITITARTLVKVLVTAWESAVRTGSIMYL